MRFSALDGLTIGVWGAGLETRSFARHVAAQLPRARIAVVVLEEPADAPELTDGARVVDASGADALRGCDVVVRSPGVSIYRPELRGLRTTTPTALWMAEREGRRVIGVTATKGKSTTSKLIAHLIARAGVEVRLGGNIGAPALDLLDDDALAVIELSSYQIADLATGPETAVVSNVYAEHVNWHGSVEAYRRDKLRLLTLDGVRRCVLNATSEAVMAAPRVPEAEAFTFGAAPGWHVTEEGAVARGDVVVSELPLIGRHNALNVCGAFTAVEAAGVPLEIDALKDFVGLDHRLQIVHEADGVRWVDDSISTEPEAAKFAVESFPDAQVVLIGGGFERSQDYTELGTVLAARGARVLGLPDTGSRLVDAVRAADGEAELVPDLPAAVAAARAAAQPGTVVLLSPAAPSFNTHKNFAARGDHFAELARAR
ncbi:UDP-N-acetylmuramoyl-L-alanine--D-glutamate ligase [Solirubrobacter sp. CPCC 204708]|uniref:UDP-N-acetylmuramoylalanine--D-glutamate ligase n=1 Tax=Solirubrobacter deserti TaxID=2282478 RepID=A0ABT4RTI8_9ACTN|nr:UDP-N-acetylmuramoyl-L-alanine--D-glutamate ligase [Solirubrobacter deserti]MBE2320351.1 UDP-N-acetylmuramoyl-L-alanine--D-glutamate ligase [Solirubrobacter deserti]MDA0141703.1 UDP-N-acetylmuramoyl-L-alanine--D-glutamate ligase [Solirubrobacter deserti]